MGPLPALDPPTWPAPDKDGNYVLTKADGQRFLVFLAALRTYLETQLEACEVKP